MKGKGRRRGGAHFSVQENICVIYIMRRICLSFILVKWASCWPGWGRAPSSSVFRAGAPSTAIRIKMEERGEWKGEEAGIVSSEDRTGGVNRCGKKRRL